ncbi:MAG: hypothetical protein ACYTG5_13535 [Planctomycetota bacterium]|jgi:hypothetical protein
MQAGERGQVQENKTVKPRRSSLRRRLGLLFASLLLAAIIVELMVAGFLVSDGRYGERPLPPYDAINTPWQAELFTRRSQAWTDGKSGEGYATFSANLGWTLLPSRQSDDGREHSNALAARGPREYAIEAPEGITRILTFGDSFTYCYLAADHETWQFQAEASDAQLEVINFGVPSYGTDQALLRFRELGRGLAARVIVMGLMLENIGRNVNRYRPIYFGQSGTLGCKPRFVLEGEDLRLLPLPYANEGEALAAIGDGSILEDLGEHEYWRDRPWVPFGKTFASLRLVAGFFAYLQRRPSALWQARQEEPYRVTLALLESFAREAKAAGATHAPILIFPTENDLNDLLDGGPAYWQPMIQDLEAREVDTIDVSSALVEACLKTNEGSGAVFSGGHLNARGNSVVARELRNWLSSRL